MKCQNKNGDSMNSRKTIPIIAIVIIFFPHRCSLSPATSATSTVVSINPLGPAITPASSGVMEGTALPQPSLTSTESEKVVDGFLRNNGECSLPCVWGIRPGQSQSIDIKRFFESFGWKGNTINDTYYIGKDLQNSVLSIRVGIYPSHGTIEKIHIALGGSDFIEKIGYFSFENIVEVLGKPSDIFVFVGTNPGVLEPIETSFEILLFYNDKNILVEYTGTAVKIMDIYRVCPSQPEAESTQVDSTAGFVSIYTGQDNRKTTPQELVRPFWVLPNYYLTVEKAFGISVDQFYVNVAENAGSVCFDSPLASWQR